MTKKSSRVRKDLETIYQFALSMTSTFNELTIAVVIGFFSALSLLQNTPRMTINWLILSFAYFTIALIAGWIYARLNLYGDMIAITKSRLFIDKNLEDSIRDEAIKRSLLVKIIDKLTRHKYYKLWKIWTILGALYIFVMWWAVAF